MTTHTVVRVDELRRLAAKATPGPWGYEPSYRKFGDVDASYYELAPLLSDGELDWTREVCATARKVEADAAYIAAANPATILALLDRLGGAAGPGGVRQRAGKSSHSLGW